MKRITKKIVFLTAWFSFLFAEIWGLVQEVEFFAALERALWFAFFMACLGWIAGLIMESTLKDIHFFDEEEEGESSSITRVDYTLPEDMPLTDFEERDSTVSDGEGEITAADFEQEMKKMATEAPGNLAETVKSELKK